MNSIQELLLKVIGTGLFSLEAPDVDTGAFTELVRESKAHAVFPLLFSVLCDQLQEKLPAERYCSLNEDLFRFVAAGTQNFAEHSELHDLMSANRIPYVIIKGFASAMYYPEPSLRAAGDVDFIVRRPDMQKAGEALESIGFFVDHGDKDDGIHIAYKRPPMSVWEMHHSVNGIPSGSVGEDIRAEMLRTIETAVSVNTEDVTCLVPDRLHHGLLLLLHTASHLTSEGVGLRHLCDWTVFASSMSDNEFCRLFENKLKRFGLWRFAQALTMLGSEYLGAPRRAWALEAVLNGSIDRETLSRLMDDILSSGNFGAKDMNRYREIKYISDRDGRTVGSGGVIRQGFRSMNEKIRAKHRLIGRHKLLYPVGYIVEGGGYLKALLNGKRKSSGTGQMLREAAKRKKLYSALDLYKK